jgi:hypothetical protein
MRAHIRPTSRLSATALGICAAVAALVLASCGSDSGSSADSAKASSPSPTPDQPRIEGDYDLGDGFIVHFEPTCDTGPCDVKVSYDYSTQRGAKGSGVLKFDGHFYRGVVHAVSGCLISNNYLPGTTVSALHYQLVGQAPNGEDIAPEISGERWGTSKLTKIGKPFPGCAAHLDKAPVHGTLQ